MSLYVYCLVETQAARAAEGMSGVGGAQVKLFAVGRLAAVVSEFAGESAAVSAENVRAHNRVNARVLACATPLPFRFGAVASESRLADYVNANAGALASALARVEGCVEMGVKIRWGAVEEGGGQTAEGGREKAEGGGLEAGGVGEVAGAARAESGTAFLLAKRREILGGESLRARAEGVAAWLAGRVAGLVRESSVRVNPSGALVVRAAHLVERVRVDEYRARVREAGAERPDIHFLTSGPWPPYSFSGAAG